MKRVQTDPNLYRQPPGTNQLPLPTCAMFTLSCVCVSVCGKYRDFAHTVGFHHPCEAKAEVSRDVKCYSVKSRGGQGGER